MPLPASLLIFKITTSYLVSAAITPSTLYVLPLQSFIYIKLLSLSKFKNNFLQKGKIWIRKK